MGFTIPNFQISPQQFTAGILAGNDLVRTSSEGMLNNVKAGLMGAQTQGQNLQNQSLQAQLPYVGPQAAAALQNAQLQNQWLPKLNQSTINLQGNQGQAALMQGRASLGQAGAANTQAQAAMMEANYRNQMLQKQVQAGIQAAQALQGGGAVATPQGNVVMPGIQSAPQPQTYNMNGGIPGLPSGTPQPMQSGAQLPPDATMNPAQSAFTQQQQAPQQQAAQAQQQLPQTTNDPNVPDVYQQEQQRQQTLKAIAVSAFKNGNLDAGLKAFQASNEPTSIIKGLQTQDLGTLKKTSDAALQANRLLQVLPEYKAALDRIPAVYFNPAGKYIGPSTNPDYQYVKGLSATRIMPALFEMSGLPARAATNADFASFRQGALDPGNAPKSALYKQIPSIASYANQVLDMNTEANRQVRQTGNLSKFNMKLGDPPNSNSGTLKGLENHFNANQQSQANIPQPSNPKNYVLQAPDGSYHEITPDNYEAQRAGIEKSNWKLVKGGS